VDEAGDARYQGLILASGGLAEAALDASQRAALERLERELGVRRLTAYAYPGAEYGLSPPVWAGPLESVSATLTPSGRQVFPYLREQLPIDAGSWAYLATPAVRKGFDTLLAGPDRSALVGIHRHPDGREEMVQLFDANPAQTHGQVLRRGQLAWLTRGTYLGFERNYLPIQIDDVLLPNHSWDVEAHETDLSPEASIRMTAEDATRAANWSRARGLRLDLACNGVGSERHARRAGVTVDPLLDALLAEREVFGWINHTYEHLDLSDVPQSTIASEIERNFSWARAAGVQFEPRAVVTGEHTGLANLTATPPRAENVHLAAALTDQRIRYLACDASRPYPARGGGHLAPGTPFVIGTAVVVPRRPTILSYDAATEAQALDRLRCASRTDGDSWEQAIELEAKRIFAAMISNDPRPHYFHQSNLIGAGDGRGAPALLFGLLDAVLRRYGRCMAPECRSRSRRSPRSEGCC
jgi:peptidoglycan/xylan/chitin deacetylase (PgdA/CDA1 family)